MQNKKHIYLSGTFNQTQNTTQNSSFDTVPICSASIEDAVNLIRQIAPDTQIETRYIDEADGYTLGAPVFLQI
jgi:hypothetical protein